MAPRVWFITGASSGFGRAMTELVLKKGDIAVATLRRPEVLADLQAQHPTSQLLVLQLDVTKPHEIHDAFQKAKDAFGRVDAVFNNAGICVLAEVEGTPDDAARAMFEVNFWGAANVGRETVRFLREENRPSGGNLINVSSIVGWAVGPAMGYYTATKHALEGLTEALAMELDPKWNIKVTLVEFGYFATKGIDNTTRVAPHPAYTNPSLASAQMRAWFASEHSETIGDPAKAVSKVYELTTLEKPPLRLALGKECVAALRDVLQKMGQGIDSYESWSENLQLDG